MQDWQIAVLNSDDLRVDQDSSTGYRLIVRRTDKEHRMPIQEVIATIRHSSRKPVIMCPDDILKGMFAPKREVLEILTSREDYQEYRMWLAEAKICGAI